MSSSWLKDFLLLRCHLLHIHKEGYTISSTAIQTAPDFLEFSQDVPLEKSQYSVNMLGIDIYDFGGLFPECAKGEKGRYS